MKRLLALFLCLCLLLCGCTSQVKETPQPTKETEPTVIETTTAATEIQETQTPEDIRIGELIFPLGNDRKFDIIENNLHIIFLTENTTYISVLCTDMKVSGNMEPEKFASVLHSNWIRESAVDKEKDFFHCSIFNNDVYFDHQVTKTQDDNTLYWLVGTFYSDSYFYTIAYTSNLDSESEIEKFSDYLNQISFTTSGAPKFVSVKQPIVKAEETEPIETKQQSIGTTYVLNTNTKKFHRPSCSSAKKMKESNKSTFTGTREDVIAKGYKACSNCNP